MAHTRGKTITIYNITFRHADTGTTTTAAFRGDTLTDAIAACEARITEMVQSGSLRPTRREIIAAEIAVTP